MQKSLEKKFEDAKQLIDVKESEDLSLNTSDSNDLERFSEPVEHKSVSDQLLDECVLSANKKNGSFKYITCGYGLSLGTRASIELVSGVLVSGAIGYFLDRALGTFPILFIIFMGLGFALSMWHIFTIFIKKD